VDRARLWRILVLAAPIVGGMTSQNLLNLVDTAMVGSLGTAALAAVGLASMVTFMSQAIVTGLSSAVQAIAARRMGEGRPMEASEALYAGIFVSVLVGVPASVLLSWWAPAIFARLSTDPEVVAQAVPYYQARMVSLVAVGINFSFRGYWNGVDRSGLYLRSLVLMHVSNVVISYGLIYGVWGLPELGSLGAGVGTAIASMIGTVSYVVLGFTHGRDVGFLRLIVPIERTRTLVRLAIPATAQQVMMAAGYTAQFWIVGQIGTDELAAASVLINLMLVALLPGMGLGLAAATLVGQALGRGDVEDASRWGWEVSVVAVAVMGLLGVPMWLAPELLLSQFLPADPAAVQVARGSLQLVGAMIWTDAIGMVLMQAMLGAGAARTVMQVAVALQWGLFLPLAWLIGPWWGLGLTAVWAAQALQRSLQAALFGWLWWRRGWASVAV
jgi:MATE family multidrug resistance protein